MDNKNIGTNLGDKLKGIEIKVKKENDPETTLPGAISLGAGATVKKTLEEAKKEGVISFIDNEILESYRKQYTTKAVADKNINELEEKIQEKIAENIEEAQKNGTEVLSKDEIILAVLKNHRHGQNKKGHVLVDFYEGKIKESKGMKEVSSEENSLFDESVVDSETEPKTETVAKSESKAGDAKVHSTQQEKTFDNKIRMPFWIFGKRYQNFFRKNVFSDFDAESKKPKGQWIHISQYNEKTGKVKCNFGSVESNKRANKTEELDLSKLDEILKGYSYDESGKNAGINHETEKKRKIKKSAGKENSTEKNKSSDVKNAEKESAHVGEIAYDDSFGTERREKEIAEFREWGQKYWDRAAKTFDWEKYDYDHKKGALIIMTEIFIKETIEEDPDFSRKEEAGKIAKEIVKKFAEKYGEDDFKKEKSSEK